MCVKERRERERDCVCLRECVREREREREMVNEEEVNGGEESCPVEVGGGGKRRPRRVKWSD